MSDFADMYRPSEEHEAFRAAVREVCEEKVAPNAQANRQIVGKTQRSVNVRVRKA